VHTKLINFVVQASVVIAARWPSRHSASHTLQHHVM